MEVTTIGIDIAKRIFQVHGVDKKGKTVWLSVRECETRGHFGEL